MELLEGQTLSGRLRQFGPFPPKQSLELIDQLVVGLAAAQDHGIVHRDFKSNNVMLVDGGLGKARAVITDFGLALSIANERSSIFEISEGALRSTWPRNKKGMWRLGSLPTSTLWAL